MKSNFIKLSVIVTLLTFLAQPRNLFGKKQSSHVKADSSETKNVSSFGVETKSFRFVLYPLGIGQYQNSDFFRAKFYFTTQVLALTTIAVSPIWTKEAWSSTSKWSLYTLGGLYLLSILDGLIFYRSGESPVQPLLSHNTLGLQLNYKF